MSNGRTTRESMRELDQNFRKIQAARLHWAQDKFLLAPVVPHKCGVPPGYGTPHLCGSEEFCRAPTSKFLVWGCFVRNIKDAL